MYNNQNQTKFRLTNNLSHGIYFINWQIEEEVFERGSSYSYNPPVSTLLEISE